MVSPSWGCFFFAKHYNAVMKLPYRNLNDYLQSDKRPEQGPAFLEHLLAKLDEHIARRGKILILTLTKKSSEEITNFLVAQ